MSIPKTSVEPPLIGYVTPLRARPGEALAFKISSVDDRPFKARVVRIDCADPNPDGPGMKLPPIDLGLGDRQYEGTYQTTRLGSYGMAPVAALPDDGDINLDLEFQPWLLNDKPQILASLQSKDGQHGVAILLTKGQVRAVTWSDLSSESSPNIVDLGACRSGDGIVVKRKHWYKARLNISKASIALSVTPYRRGEQCGDPRAITVQADTQLDRRALECLVIAAWVGGAAHALHYNGRIGNVGISLGLPSQIKPLERWDFSANMTGFVIPNSVSDDRPLTLHNAPMRAVQGLGWQGTEMVWKTAPAQYAAVHFHEDDLGDCDWDTSLELSIPTGTKSGVYGLVVENEHGSDTIPFFVLPAKSGPHAKVAYLASTLTYLAYGNHARDNFAGELEDRVRAWGAYPYNPDVVTRFGFSTYNRHPDGHGLSLSSRLRPLLTMRPGYLTFCDPAGSGLRHFPADSHLTDWLTENGIEFDVITDEDLHDEGAALLAPYSLLLTGSHPEYHTAPMLDALIEFRQAGGHLAYLGGNGFYWKIALGGPDNSLMEVRRAEGGIRAWASEPGEYYHQLDGTYGGLWRRNGIPPQTVGSVGFAVQGGFAGSWYRRTEESYDPAVSWLFENVDEERFGSFGLSGGGAAGFELDQVDPSLGTPEGTFVIAVSEVHDPTFKQSPEEILTWTLPGSSERPYPGVRAHMAYTVPNNGCGSIFAAGSITFLGSLAHNNYDNAISHILKNYISRCISDAHIDATV